jgi:hypothetical protein
LGPVGPTDKENQVKMYISTVLVLYITSLKFCKDPDHFRIKQLDPDPYQTEKQDPDPYQSEKQDLDPYQKGLDPQH